MITKKIPTVTKPRSSEEYEYDHSYQQQQQHQQQQQPAPHRTNGIGTAHGGSGGGARGQYSVAGTHDYLGYPKDQQPFGSQGGLWDDDDERREEMW